MKIAKIDWDDIKHLVMTFKTSLENQLRMIEKLRTRVGKQDETICKLDGGHDFQDFSEWEDHWTGFEFVPAGIRLRCANCGAEELV